MLLVVCPEIVLLEVTENACRVMARALKIPSSMVKVTWEMTSKGLTPRIDVELPPMLPPSDLDVTDPAALAAWEAEHQDVPGLREMLSANGVEDPDRLIAVNGQLMINEVRRRMVALGALS